METIALRFHFHPVMLAAVKILGQLEGWCLFCILCHPRPHSRSRTHRGGHDAPTGGGSRLGWKFLSAIDSHRHRRLFRLAWRLSCAFALPELAWFRNHRDGNLYA